MAQSTMILPFSILILATPISFSAVMISCRLALLQYYLRGIQAMKSKNIPYENHKHSLNKAYSKIISKV